MIILHTLLCSVIRYAVKRHNMLHFASHQYVCEYLLTYVIYSLHIYVYVIYVNEIRKLSLYVIEYRVASEICARGIYITLVIN